MDMKAFAGRISSIFKQYKYAAFILLVGILLMCLPSRKTQKESNLIQLQPDSIQTTAQQLEEILQYIEGTGKVRVYLTEQTGEKTLYQTDQTISASSGGDSKRYETITVTDEQRNQHGLVTQIMPPTYQGAIIVCSGADSPSVRLAIVNAVSRVTGLRADRISVLKMK